MKNKNLNDKVDTIIMYTLLIVPITILFIADMIRKFVNLFLKKKRPDLIEN